REIVIGMPGRPSLQDQASLAKINCDGVVDKKRGRDDANLIHQLAAHDPAKCIEIELAARSHRARQVSMTDEHGSIADKRSVSKDVIRVAVRVDDAADRLFRAGADRCQQLLALTDAASAVDYRNR